MFFGAKKISLFISITILCCAFSIEEKLLEENLKFNLGKGQVNGVELPIISIEGEENVFTLKKRLESMFKDKLTITAEETNYGHILVLAPIKSKQCTSCAIPTTKNIQNIIENTYTISSFDNLLKSPVYVGSYGGKLLVNKSNNIPMFKSEFSHELKSLLTPQAHSEFLFNNTYVQQFIGDSALDLSITLFKIFNVFESNGYQKINYDYQNVYNQEEESISKSIWKKNSSFVFIQGKQKNKTSSQVEIYESITKK